MSDFEKIDLFEHARKKLFNGTLSENDFRVIVDECSKSPFEIITQKIKKMGEAAIKELKIRAQRMEEGLSPYPDFCDFDVAMDVLVD
jgi:hypothetical protein